MEFRVLGPLEVRDGRRIIEIGGGRRRALLALLLVHRNEVVPAERLIDELWDGAAPPSASKGLQVHVSHLRKELGAAGGGADGALRTQVPGYVLEVDPQAIDAVRFEQILNDAFGAREDGRADETVARIREALALWRGPPLVDFAYDRFARAEITRLEELHLLALEERIDAELALRHHREVLAEVEQLTVDHPSSERLRGLLMVALYRSGRRAQALDVYREARARSVEELGIELGPDLRELERAILVDDASLAAPPRDPARPSGRVAAVLLVASVLLAAAAVAAFLLEDRGTVAASPRGLDLENDAVAGIDTDGRPAFGILLAGHPTDLAARRSQVYTVTDDLPSLTIADARTRRVRWTVPLEMVPAAVAVGVGSVWVADGVRGLALRLDPDDGRVAARARWRRNAGSEAARTGIAVTGSRAWVAFGSRTIVRAERTGATRRIRLPYAADGLVAGAGAVWAFNTRTAAVMRVDVRTGRTTDVIRLAGHAGAGSPQPTAAAASGSSVWMLNGNTATLSRIDASTRAVISTTDLPPARSPRDVAAAEGVVWVACLDGSLIRVTERGVTRITSTRGALVAAAASGRLAWVASRRLTR